MNDKIETLAHLFYFSFLEIKENVFSITGNIVSFKEIKRKSPYLLETKKTIVSYIYQYFSYLQRKRWLKSLTQKK